MNLHIYSIYVSTPNAPNQLFQNIENEPVDTCIYTKLRFDYTYGIGKIYSTSDIDRAKQSLSRQFEREMNLKYLGLVGNTFLTSWIEKAKSFDYDADLIHTQSSRIIACDPSWGSSAFGICVTDYRDGKICDLYADEYSNETAENMVDLVPELYYKYSPIEKIFVDGSQISFIKSLKIALYDEIREETDYQKQIQRYKDNNCDYTLNMKILPVAFTAESSKTMLSHLKSILEGGYIMIHLKFEKLLLALHTCFYKEVEDVESRLKNEGSKVADVGCRHGVSTVLMAKAYPNSKVIGFDIHKSSIE